MTDASTLLSGVTVVALEQYISAPYCTQILAEAGATVIKVERPRDGDPRRGYAPTRRLGDETISGGFAGYNRGKLSVCLDLTQESDRAQLADLVGTADVLVSNLRPGALSRAGFDPRTLRSEQPRLVICEITGFGTNGGPAHSWLAFDSVIQAMSGLSSLLGGAPEDPPLLAPMGTMDILTGIWAALGIALALTARDRTGEGAYIDAAMLDIGAAFVERPLALFEFSGEVPTRGRDDFSPVGVFRANDGCWLSIVIPTDDMWSRCCAAIGRPALVGDPRLNTVLKRAGAMKTLIVPLLEEWASRERLTASEAAVRMRRSGQPIGVVQTIEEVRTSKQLKHRGLFAPLSVRQGDQIIETDLRLPRLPLRFDDTSSLPGPVPALGEHNGLFQRLSRD